MATIKIRIKNDKSVLTRVILYVLFSKEATPPQKKTNKKNKNKTKNQKKNPKRTGGYLEDTGMCSNY